MYCKTTNLLYFIFMVKTIGDVLKHMGEIPQPDYHELRSCMPPAAEDWPEFLHPEPQTEDQRKEEALRVYQERCRRDCWESYFSITGMQAIWFDVLAKKSTELDPSRPLTEIIDAIRLQVSEIQDDQQFEDHVEKTALSLPPDKIIGNREVFERIFIGQMRALDTRDEQRKMLLDLISKIERKL